MTPVHVAGYDGSPASRAAVELALLLGRPLGARTVAVTGYDLPIPALGPGATLGADALLAEEARHAAAAVAADLHLSGVERITHPGPAVVALCRVAERERADLIVVGTTHRGGLGRLYPGSIAEQLVHGAPCAVAVAPEDARGGPLRTIAVAYDRSREARAALDVAVDLALAHGAALRVLTVYPAPAGALATVTPAGTAVPEVDHALRERLEHDLDGLVGGLPPELHPTAEVLPGWAGRALVEACATGVDLLVAGSRSYGPVRGALAGSVSRELVDHASCPVLVVPRGIVPTSRVSADADARLAASS